MTTVYIDNFHKLVITDTRVTYMEYTLWQSFLRKFFKDRITGKSKYSVVNQKAIYVYDHLFVCAGDVNAIEIVLNELTSGNINNVKTISNKDTSCNCKWIFNDYIITFTISNGKLQKSVKFMKSDYKCSFGSGCCTPPIDRMVQESHLYEIDEVIDHFKKIKNFDIYTNDLINIYRF